MNTDLCLSVPTNPKILCWQERIFLREIRALRGFAVNPGLDLHREGAKHAKKTRRTLVWLRLCCPVVIGGFLLCSLFVPQGPHWIHLRCAVRRNEARAQRRQRQHNGGTGKDGGVGSPAPASCVLC